MELAIRILLWAPAFIMAISVHEAAHAWAAWKLGDSTAKMEGRLTLDPRAHFDPFGAIMFVLACISGIGFGWAKPVPVNYYYLRRPLRDMALIAAAGPASNVLQAIGWMLIAALLALLYRPLASTPLALPLTVLGKAAMAGVWINIGMAVFNMLPIPPLDGSRIAVALLPADIGIWIARMEPIGFLILLIALQTGIFGAAYFPVALAASILLVLLGVPGSWWWI